MIPPEEGTFRKAIKYDSCNKCTMKQHLKKEILKEVYLGGKLLTNKDGSNKKMVRVTQEENCSYCGKCEIIIPAINFEESEVKGKTDEEIIEMMKARDKEREEVLKRTFEEALETGKPRDGFIGSL